MRRLLVVPLLLAALVVSGCGATAAPAAEVNGVAISDSALRDELRVLRDFPTFAEAFLGVNPAGRPDTSVGGPFAAQVLTIQIVLQLVESEVEARGLPVTQADLDETRAGFGPQFQALLAQLPEDYQRRFVEWNAQVAVLRDDLAGEVEAVTDEAVRAFYDANVTLFVQSCLSHILVDTEAEALDVLAEIGDGLAFADAAAQYSVDPSAAVNGGDLGCSAPGTFVPGFEEAAFVDAPVGEPFGPVESTFGFHLLLVRERGPVGFDEVADQIRFQLENQAASAPQQALSDWLDGAIATARVEVSSRYGTWSPAAGEVIPPSGPSFAVPTPFPG